MTAAAAAFLLPRRRSAPSIDTGALALGAPIIAYATSRDGKPWAAAGDRLLVGAPAGAMLATVEVTASSAADVLRVWRVSGELMPGDCRTMRTPTVPLDRRAFVRRARLEVQP